MEEKTAKNQTLKIKTTQKDLTENKNLAFLNELYKNVQMGKLSFEYLLPKVKDNKLKEELLKQYHDYEKLTASISGAIIEMGKTPKSSLGMIKPMLKSSINMTTMFNSSNRKIADMVIQGGNKGIMDINRLLNRSSKSLPEKSIKLANTLLETQQRHIDELKKWL